MYTNMSLHNTVDYICQYINSSCTQIYILTSILRALILRCTINKQFLFCGRFYRQIDGLSIGSLLGQLLADIFMSQLDWSTLDATINCLVHYRRYKPDIFIIHNSDIDSLLDALNKIHPALSFSYESGKAYTLVFLYMLLKRRADESIQTSVYHKPTSFWQHLNFISVFWLKRKRNSVKSPSSQNIF